MQITQQIPKNTSGRDFVIGDLHGCLDELKHKMDLYRVDITKDRIFSVGDLIDRGQHSYECLSLILEPWFFAVRGNHEELMLSAISNYDVTQHNGRMWYPDGGDWYIEHQKNHGTIPKDILQKVSVLPFINVVQTPSGNRVNILHAELPPNTTDYLFDTEGFAMYELSSLLWGRTRISNLNRHTTEEHFTTMDKDLSPTYVGHTAVKKPFSIGKYNYIDTGAVFDGGYLTMIELT